MTPAPKPLLVGESNPYGPDPAFALYPLPESSAAGRLCSRVMGLSRGRYLRSFDRANLCAGEWSMREARSRARDLLSVPRSLYVLCGAKVARAFGVDYEPLSRIGVGGLLIPTATLLVIPHPSGLCRFWNEPGAFERARAFLRENGVLPDGEA